MNPRPPFHPAPSPPFTSLPPLPPPSTTPTPSSSAAPDLPTALTTLTSLLRLTRTTLHSLSPLLPSPSPSPSPSTLIPCPFNPNHLLPPSSLFSHHLSCPSSPTPLDPLPILHSLNYPKTLHSSSTNSFFQSLQNPSSTNLCFSLENFLNFPQNFFYSNCPGPVVIRPSDRYHDSCSSPPMLTLPGFLSGECANFTQTNGCLDDKGFDLESIRLLPSEIWVVRNESEAWVDYPRSYSSRVLRIILGLCKSNLSCLQSWVVVNSPKYGVAIDLAMRDHIVLLFKLCLKAIIKEAIGFSGSLFSGNEEDKNIFDCPVLVEVMKWLGSQLALLYGEVSGNFFAINMLKQCVLDSALSFLFFPLMEKARELPELIEKSGENDRKNMVDESVENSLVFVSQVAAAVAALYERSWLEEKIKLLRDTRPLTAYQRAMEHEYISKRAHDERQKLPDYRPIIEHDGLLWQQAQNQEPNRIKTREELLAEERDYKRRRMSYRGKKMKRTTTQVMRDIIDEFMDEIRQASGHGFAKDGGKEEARAFESSMHYSSSDTLEPRKSEKELETIRKDQRVYGAQLHSHDACRSMPSEDKYLEHYKEQKRSSWQQGENLGDDRSIKRVRHYRKKYSRSPDRQQSDYHLHGYTRSRGSRDEPEISGAIISRSSDGSLSKSDERKSFQREEDGPNCESRNRHKRKKHNDIRSSAEFEDRYNPSESHDNYEDDA